MTNNSPNPNLSIGAFFGITIGYFVAKYITSEDKGLIIFMI